MHGSFGKAGRLAVLLAALLAFAACGAKSGANPDAQQGAEAGAADKRAAEKEAAAVEEPPANPLPYDVRFKVAAGSSKDCDILPERMKSLSQLVFMQSKPADGELGVELRARQDVKTAVSLMQSECWYDGEAEFTISGAESGKALVVLTMKPGTRYAVGDVTLMYSPAPRIPESMRDKAEKLFPAHYIDGVEKGKPITAAKMLERVSRIPDDLKKKGFPDAEIKEQHYYLDRGKHTLNVALVVAPGTAATIGNVVVSGESQVNPDFVARLAEWEPGREIWDSERVADYITALRRTGLFANVTPVVMATGEAGPDGLGQKPVGVQLTDAKHRTVSAQVQYSTDTGIGLVGQWEHRNLFKNGEKLTLSMPISITEAGLKAKFEKPEFLARHQSLKVSGSALREQTDGYDRNGVKVGVGVERKLNDVWSVYGGLFGDVGIMDTTDKSNLGYRVYGASFKVTRDTRSDPVNPVSGTKVVAEVFPMTGDYDGDFTALGGRLSLAGYWAPFTKQNGDPDDKLVFAAKAETGSITGAELRNVPPSQRFFLGGAGTVRGYGYQQIGPMDRKNEPLGARSYQFVNLESRFRITDDLGFVLFADGGKAYTDEMPEFSGDMDWGVGTGLRYFTPIGPVRFDIAFPLKESDPPLQFYISIGQAF